MELEFLKYLAQLPIVGVVIWLVFKFVHVIREERDKFIHALTQDREAFLNALDTERMARERSQEKLETSFSSLNLGVNSLTHVVTELRADMNKHL